MQHECENLPAICLTGKQWDVQGRNANMKSATDSTFQPAGPRLTQRAQRKEEQAIPKEFKMTKVSEAWPMLPIVLKLGKASGTMAVLVVLATVNLPMKCL